jgi:hypothetical protein
LGGQLEIEEAMADFDAIDADLENADFSAKQGNFLNFSYLLINSDLFFVILLYV